MFYLILSVFTSTLFAISFKIIANKKIDAFQSIIVNYIAAFILGFATTKSDVTLLNFYNQKWFFLAVFLGFVFIFSLLIIAKVTANSGISVAQVANRMAVVIPISIALVFYNDAITPIKIIGIILALLSVYLVSNKRTEPHKLKEKWWLLPIIIFLCSGTIDSSINYAQKFLLNKTDFDAFLATIFLTAFIIGGTILSIQLYEKKCVLDYRTIPSGIIMGCINFGTMFTIVQALNSNVFEPSVLFPINNLSVLLVSTLLSVFIYKEKLTLKNWLGISLSLIAIVLLGLLN